MTTHPLTFEDVFLGNLPSLDLKISMPSTKSVKLLVLHGGPGMDCSYFLPFLEPLKSKVNLLFYTQGSSGALTMAGLLNELHSILQHFKNDQIVILAHSFGAALIFEYIRIYGDSFIAALILISWIYDIQWLGRYLDRFSSESSEETYTSDDDYKIQTMRIANHYFDSPFVDAGREALGKIKYNATLSNAIWKDFLSGFDGRQVVRNFSKPALSLSGTEDLITDIGYIHEGAKLNLFMEMIDIDNAGHFPFFEKPTVVNQAVLKFLDCLLIRSINSVIT